MRVVTDKKFVPSRINQARLLTAVGLVLLVGGWLSSFNAEWILASLLALLVGFPLFNAGRYMAIRWGSKPREDEVLVDELKGLDQRYTLYNYIPKVPVEHFMVTPAGIYVIETRHQLGHFAVKGDPTRNRDRWSRVMKSPLARFFTWTRSLSEGALGNPSNDLKIKMDDMRKYLAENLPADIMQTSTVKGEPDAGEDEPAEDEAPIRSNRGGFELPGLFGRRPATTKAWTGQSPLQVGGVAVFINPKAKVDIENPVVPVVQPDELKTFFRSQVQQEGANVRLSMTTLRRLSRLWESADSESRIAATTRPRRMVGRPRTTRSPLRAAVNKDANKVTNKK